MCVSHEVARWVRRLPSSGPGPVDTDSHPGSTANEQCDWGKSLKPSRPQAQELRTESNSAQGPQEKLPKVKVQYCTPAGRPRASRQTSARSAPTAGADQGLRWGGQRVAGRGEGCAREQEDQWQCHQYLLTWTQAGWQRKFSSVVNTYVENGEQVT